MSTPTSKQPKKSNNQKFATIWRWHFYAGFFIAPILIMLSVTGLAMMLFANIDGRDGEYIQVDVPTEAVIQPISQQAQSAINAVENGQLKQYIAPRAHNMVSVFRVDESTGEDAKPMFVAINPYTAEVVKTYPRHDQTYHFMNDIHGDMLIGKKGDFLIETAASFAILMIVTGWYLWWVRQKSMGKVLFPKLRNLSNPRVWWRNLHGATGVWVSIILLFFLISGLSWAGIWGGKMVQAWSQFPAGKWGNPPVPESTLVTHGEVLNNGNTKEVPWALELTPMPFSNPENKTDSVPALNPKALENLDVINAYARKNGFEGRYQAHLPKSETGVWTLSQDSMSYDSKNPMADRTVHLDQYTGEQLADIRYEDYSWFGKFMAVGIALHMGTLGWWSILANALFCLAVIGMCIGGYVMWWKRRPSNNNGQSVGLNPPPAKSAKSVGFGFGVLLVALAVAFPTAIIAIVTIALLDFIIISRLDFLKRLLK